MNSNTLRLAVITDWNAQCGISTYSKYLLDALYPKLDSMKIFSEMNDFPRLDEEVYDVDYCWKRGTPMTDTVKKILAWKPSVILLQHEFGLFAKANYFLKMLEGLNSVPIVTTLHSVYEHLDKSVCTSALNNIVVHSDAAKHCLRHKLGHRSQFIYTIPHGVIDLGDIKPNFNSFNSKHPILQFGFGFEYKGVDVALEAISVLRKRHPKFDDIFYLYLLSENSHTKNIHDKYARELREISENLGVSENFSILRGFKSDEEINQYLRTTRLSIFPYKTDKKNVVFGASGAIRLAMANGNPVIASDSHMFDDLEGVLPRPSNPNELANEIAKSFGDGQHRKEMLRKQREYVLTNTWDITADRYKDVLLKVQNS